MKNRFDLRKFTELEQKSVKEFGHVRLLVSQIGSSATKHIVPRKQLEETLLKNKFCVKGWNLKVF